MTQMVFSKIKKYFIGSFVFLLASNAWAQDQDIESLISKIDRLQREVSDLQSQLYTGKKLPTNSTTLSNSGVTGSVAASQEVKIQELGRQINQLNGQVEEINFSVKQLKDKMDKFVADVDFRFKELEGKKSSDITSPSSQIVNGQNIAPKVQDNISTDVDDGTDINSIQPADVNGSSSKVTSPLNTTNNAGSKGILGTIPQKKLNNVLATAPKADAAQAAAMAGQDVKIPGKTPKEQYDYAFSLMRQSKFTEAEIALKSFISQYPDNEYTANAQYWLGETYYVRSDFESAAQIFAENYQKYPNSTKAPDSLLKLGMSLSELGASEDACKTLSELPRRYPNASKTLLTRADNERKRISCPL
ncbi:MAG: tol-pal system protein YbgF [Alphaproteobacteria bacterium]|nr:tol-pal system protein YbgF [Alphaproteobacteria bacterium]